MPGVRGRVIGVTGRTAYALHLPGTNKVTVPDRLNVVRRGRAGFR